jgi:hypothetical protein
MTSPKEVQADLSNAVARWENEGGAPGRLESDKNTDLFVPPLVIPALLVALIVARFAYVAYS